MTDPIKKILTEIYDDNSNDSLNIQTFKVSNGCVDTVDEKNNTHDVFNKLKECVQKLEKTDYKYVRQFIELWCEEDKKDLIKQFKKEFENVPKKDKLRLETLHFLAKLGIVIYD